MTHYINDSATTEWLNEWSNIDGTDPDGYYVGKLPFDEMRVVSRDAVNGNAKLESEDDRPKNA